MATVSTGAGAKKFIKPDYIVLTLFNGTENNDTPLGDKYIIEDVIEDTTAITQDNNSSTRIECETSDSPVIEIVTQGAWSIAAEIGDTQHTLLEKFAGFIYDSTTGRSYAPSTYKPIYAKFDIVYKDGADNFVAYVAPKVQLNSKILIESLSSNLGRISLAGTPKDITVTVNGKSVKTPFYTDEQYPDPTASDI